MRFKRHTKIEYGLAEIDIAPLVDCIFLLLIFFMLSSAFVFQSGIKVRLPRAITSEIIQEENLIIVITSENVMYLNDTIVTVKELRTKLSKPDTKKRPILIKADRRASLGRVIDIWDLCRDLGIEQVNIAANRDTQ